MPAHREPADPSPGSAPTVTRQPTVSAALTAKLLPPVSDARGTVPRPALEARLEDAAGRRLAVLVAGAGFGKSTLAAGLAARRRSAWYTVDAADRHIGTLAAGLAAALRRVVPDLPADVATPLEGFDPQDEADAAGQARAAAALLSDALQATLDGDVLLVMDDLQVLDGAPAWRLVEGLVRLAPPEVHLLLASRTDPPFAIERLRGQGQVVDLGGGALAFDEAETEALVRNLLGDRLGPDQATEAARRILEATGGWPAAVRLAIEALRAAGDEDREAALGRLRHPDGPLFAYLAEEVFSRESAATQSLVRRMAAFERFTPALCAAVGVEDAEAVLRRLVRRSLFVQTHPEGEGWYTLHGLIREYALAHLPLGADERRDVHRRAAAWFEAAGLEEQALAALVAADDPDALAGFLTAHAGRLAIGGAPAAVVEAAGRLPAERLDARVERACGEAHLARGEWRDAYACFERSAGRAGKLDAATAWRMGLVHGLRGAYAEALAIYESAQRDGSQPADEALLDAWMASAHYHQGDAEASRAEADRSLATALRVGDPRAEAAARTGRGMSLELQGDVQGAVAEYALAQAAARRAGDALQEVRIRVARGALEIDAGRFAEAVESLDGAVQLAVAVGFAAFHARALAARGRAKQGIGRFEEALTDFVAARAIYERIGSPAVAYALVREGNLHLLRGDAVLARSSFESAVRTARSAHDHHALGQALIGLAQTIVSDDPDAARALADEAVAIGRDTNPMSVLLGAARVDLALGDRDTARARAAEVGTLAGPRGDRPALAAALEIQALATAEGTDAAALIEQAAAIWAASGAPYGAARNRLAAARVLDGAEARDAAREAERAFRALGARGPAAEAAELGDALDRASRPALSIQSLGRFRVVRDGEPVAATAWQSKKARDLLKILVARRGRPTTRETFFDLLWPDEDPGPLSNRLSVALATVRTVLDPDKRHAADYFIAADKTALSLDLDHVELDVERFRAEAAAGARLLRSGERAAALARFETAEALYSGDFLEEDPYEDWAVGLREEAQATYIAVARALAAAAAERGDADAATRYYLRILERDAFDEGAHLGLVAALAAAGRHGEARRRYASYAAKMEEIAVEAAPFPAAPRSGPRTPLAVPAG